jgi:hypothetical protein
MFNKIKKVMEHTPGQKKFTISGNPPTLSNSILKGDPNKIPNNPGILSKVNELNKLLNN